MKPPQSAAPISLDKPLTIAILAMGGQGGGVLADWIVEVAEHVGMGGAIDIRAGRRAAHRRDDLLHRDAAAAKRRRARLLAHADAGRCRRGDGGGAHGGWPIGPARAGDAGQDDAHRLDPPRLCGGREGKAGRRRGRFVRGRRCARFRRAADHRLRHGEARGRTRHGDLGRDARRARRFGRAAVRAVGLRSNRARRRARREREPCRIRRRL